MFVGQVYIPAAAAAKEEERRLDIWWDHWRGIVLDCEWDSV